MTAEPATAWRSRIVGEATVDPRTLTEHPDNWRLHPGLQQRALAGVLDEVGWVQRVLVNRRSGRLIDGHLRVALARERGEASIPVQYVDLSEAEEAAVLATLDPITGLARADASALEQTLKRVRTESGAVQQLLERVAEGAGLTLEREGATDPDDVPFAAPPRSRPGDCWQLGAHRLLCGDATDSAAVATLMGSERAAVGVQNSVPFRIRSLLPDTDDLLLSHGQNLIRTWSIAASPDGDGVLGRHNHPH